MNHENKKEEANLEVIQRISTDILLQNIPVDELLGSVTTYSEGNDKNLALRSSARVFKKIKLDANLLHAANTPEKAAPEKKEEPKPEQNPHKEPRKFNIPWTNEEVTALFFEALNEYGKDFESIHSTISLKLKKKGVSDELTKEQVRHIYYRTWHKISKYLKFSEGVKRNIQELYGLINYGELRKKVPITQKILVKLNELVHIGCVSLRVKGKMFRVRTPMCSALRRLNKLDDKVDDLKLPSRVVVQLQPRDMQSFLKVQSFALNPRIRTELPLQKKLSTFINCVSKRWKSAEFEYIKNNYPKEEISNGENDEVELDIESRLITSQLKFTPPKEVKLNLAKTEVCDFITKENICLNAYEERMGIDSTKISEKKDCKKSSQKTKTDNILETVTKSTVKSEVKDSDQILTDETKEIENTAPFPPNALNVLNAVENLSHQLSTKEDSYQQQENHDVENEECNILTNQENTSDSKVLPNISKHVSFKKESECSETPQTTDTSDMLVDKPQTVLSSEENPDNNIKNNKDISVEEQSAKLTEIWNGWTVEDCDNLTIGELYLMFGSASKLVLEYHWVHKSPQNSKEDTEIGKKCNESSDKPLENFGFSDMLRKLVDVMKMQQKKVVPKCSCGHVCSPKNNTMKKVLIKVTDGDEKICSEENFSEMESSQNLTNGEDQKQRSSQFEDFAKPQCKPPPHLIAQLDSIEKLKPKYTIRKGRRQRTTQLVVERELPLMPKVSSGHQIVRMNIISQNGTNSNQQLPTSTEDQEMEIGASECDNENNFEQVFYMEENCNQYVENVGAETSNIALNVNGTTSTIGASNIGGYLDMSRSLSPSVILKENESEWISSEVADFSLSSFLGHLESPMKGNDDVSNDMDCQLRSLLTENSFDYTAKFADLANKVVGDTAN